MFFEDEEHLYAISNIEYTILENPGEIRLRWNWPNDMDAVFLYKVGGESVAAALKKIKNEEVEPFANIDRGQFNIHHGMSIVMKERGRVRLLLLPVYGSGDAQKIILQNRNNVIDIVAQKKEVYWQANIVENFLMCFFSGKTGINVHLSITSSDEIGSNVLQLVYNQVEWPIGEMISPGTPYEMDLIMPRQDFENLSIQFLEPADSEEHCINKN